VDAALVTVAALGGLAVGVIATLAFRLSERANSGPAAQPEPTVPPGAAAVLSVLTSQSVLVDEELEVVRASPAANAYGLVRAGRIVPPDLVDMVRATQRDGVVRDGELDLASEPLGAPRHVRIRVTPLGARLVLLLAEDRTEPRRVEAVRRDFVANVSHELKTPVGALALLAEAVGDAADDPDSVRRFAVRMSIESERLTGLVHELLELSRVQGDDPLDHPEPVAVAAVVREALGRAGELAASRKIDLVAEVARDAPVPPAVLGSERQLVMALGNLVDNAVAYSSEGGRVVVVAREQEHEVVITVTDNGIGIPPAEQERIFERFYRLDPARTRANGGTGLGLAIVKHIVAVHGGDVSVTSTEGVGSTFTVRLPAYHAASATEAVSRKEERAEVTT
jgi:two-component system sensor histidine kinase SenX3